MRDKNVWQARIEQAARDAEIGNSAKMKILLDEIMALQEAAQQGAQSDGADGTCENCGNNCWKLVCETCGAE